jgi:hypothetical protein
MRKNYLAAVYRILGKKELDVNDDFTDSKLVYKEMYYRYYAMSAAMINIINDARLQILGNEEIFFL